MGVTILHVTETQSYDLWPFGVRFFPLECLQASRMLQPCQNLLPLYGQIILHHGDRAHSPNVLTWWATGRFHCCEHSCRTYSEHFTPSLLFSDTLWAASSPHEELGSELPTGHCSALEPVFGWKPVL